MKNIEIWEKVKNDLKKEIDNDNFYNEFISKTYVENIIDNTIILKTPNEFSKKILINNYKQKIVEFFYNYSLLKYNIEILSFDEKFENNTKRNIYDSNLNPKLNFSNFIVGKFNKKAYNACKILIDDETISNILFIHGTPGVGKTHLINALGLEFQNNFKKVLIINGEDFVRKIYKIISQNIEEIEDFKDSFNYLDVLIVDDIQFFSKKEKINEIFFSIFNNLINNNKIVIITSDKKPNQLLLDNRMISRFNSGLNVEISKPDVDSVFEIIKDKIEKENFNIPFTNNAIKYIANRFNSDIRIIEGLIKKIKFYLLTSELDTNIVNENKISEIIENEVLNEYSSNEIKINPEIIIENIYWTFDIYTNIIRIVYQLFDTNLIENKFEILKEAISNNRSLYPAVHYVQLLISALNKEDGGIRQDYVTKENIEILKNTVLDNIYSWKDNDIHCQYNKTIPFEGSLIRHQRATSIFYFWFQYGNRSLLEEYVNKMTENTEGLLTFLKAMRHKVKSSSEYEYNEYFEISSKTLANYFNLDNLMIRLNQIDKDSLLLEEQDLITMVLNSITQFKTETKEN